MKCILRTTMLQALLLLRVRAASDSVRFSSKEISLPLEIEAVSSPENSVPLARPAEHSVRKIQGSHLQREATEHGATRDLIVGGTLATAREFPWFVATTAGGFCGASLIAPSVVLTAAHCSALFGVGSTVLVGAFKRNTLNAGAQAREVTQRVRHPDYDDTTLNYDFMLLQLNEPVTDVEPLAWNKDPTMPAAGTKVTVMGFGRTEYETGDTSDELLKVDLEIFPDDTCERRYGSNNLDITTMICSMAPSTATQAVSACQGDSGGPLVMMDNGVPLQVGVVSWGIACGSDYYPGVYSRPSGVLDWMNTTICDLSPECSGNGSGPATADPGSFTLSVLFQYDDYPEETTWALIRVYSDGTEDVFATGPPSDNLPDPNTRWEYSLDSDILDQGTYRFAVYDSAGDGLKDGAGYEITVTTPYTTTDGVLVASGPPAFTTEALSDVFDVPPANAAVPTTPAPTTPAPATSSTTTQSTTTSTQPCVCLAGPQVCREQFCFAAEDKNACLNLGCTWLPDGGATPPPDVEKPNGDDGENGGFQTQKEDMTDMQKAGFSLLVGVGVAVVIFVIVGGIMYFRHRRQVAAENDVPTPNAPIDYPEIKPRGTATTEDLALDMAEVAPHGQQHFYTY